MTKRTQKQPANPFHPGEILLEEFLEPRGGHPGRVRRKGRLDEGKTE